MHEIKDTTLTFEDIKHIDKNGHEFWYVRELAKILEYKSWDKFKNVLNKAMASCENSGNQISNHFVQVGKWSN